MKNLKSDQGGIFLPTKLATGKIRLPPLPETQKPRPDRVGSPYPLVSVQLLGLGRTRQRVEFLMELAQPLEFAGDRVCTGRHHLPGIG